jgi:site-specific DNA-methyltransferase (adenine-specific)
MEAIQLHHGDCLGENGMKTLADKSIDMILCDLPYGITTHHWDKGLDLEAVFKEYMRVIKDNGAIVLFGCQPFTTDLINVGRKWFRYELIWSKSFGSDFLNANRKPMKSHENLSACVLQKVTNI